MSLAPFQFRRSIATVSLAGTLPEKLEAAASVGFNGVELFENDLLTFDGPPAEVRRIGRELGVAITAFQPFRDFEAMPEPTRAEPGARRTQVRCDASARHRSAARLQQCPPGGDRISSNRRTASPCSSGISVRTRSFGRPIIRIGTAFPRRAADAPRPAGAAIPRAEAPSPGRRCDGVLRLAVTVGCPPTEPAEPNAIASPR